MNPAGAISVRNIRLPKEKRCAMMRTTRTSQPGDIEVTETRLTSSKSLLSSNTFTQPNGAISNAHQTPDLASADWERIWQVCHLSHGQRQFRYVDARVPRCAERSFDRKGRRPGCI